MKYMKLSLLLIYALIITINVSSAALSEGEAAPDFTLTTTAGEEITLSDYRGQVVILHFWKSN
jgi:peroxiredoxin